MGAHARRALSATGAELLVAELERAGVERIFGIPGTSLVDVWESLRRAEGPGVVRSTTELMSAFAANGHARATGRPAVLFTIAGPGLAYAVPGIAEAFYDSVPLVCIADALPAAPAGSAATLAPVRQADVVGPIVKRVVTVTDASGIAAATQEAFAAAGAEEPGPVLLEIAPGALSGRAAERPPAYAAAASAAPADVAAVAERLRGARRPVLLVGQGAASAAAEITALAERLQAPVISTTSGRGVVSELHPLCLAHDVPGGSPRPLAAALEQADAVLVLGAKLSRNALRGEALVLPPGRLIQVDASDAVLQSPPVPSLAVRADVTLLVRGLLELTEGHAPQDGWGSAEVAALRTALAADRPARLCPTLGGGAAAELFQALREALPDSAVVATDSGFHQYLVRTHLPVVAPRTLLVPTGFQSMGFGVPAALGASLATRGPAVAVTGDAGLGIVGLELLTAVRERLPLTVIVLVDGYLGLIRLSQLSRTGRPVDVDVDIPDLSAFAGSLGAGYVRIDGSEPVREALGRAVGAGGPVIVEVPVGELPGSGRLAARGRVQSLGRGTIRRLGGAG